MHVDRKAKSLGIDPEALTKCLWEQNLQNLGYSARFLEALCGGFRGV